MIKKLAFLFFFLLTGVFVFGTDFNVCIYPQNDELSELVKPTFTSIIRDNKEIPVRYIESSVSFHDELFYKYDTNYLNMICDKDNLDILLISRKEEDNVRLSVYTRSDCRITELGNNLSSIETLIALLPFFPISDSSTENEIKNEVLYRENPISVDCLNTVADLYVNGEFVGKTPYVIREYSLPLSLEFKAEGFNTRIVMVDDLGKDINVELKKVEMNSGEIYRQSKKQFYRAFSNSLILIGIEAAARSFIPKESKAYKITNTVLQSLTAVSFADTCYRLFKYYKSAQQLVP